MPAVIRTERLRKVYGSTVAVDALDLSVEQGEIFGLLGPNGAGKTTTVAMLATIVRPTSGRAEVDGCSVVDAPGRVRRSGTYSGGMKRRLELVRGLLHRPRVLFLDEPTLGLDPQSRRVIWDYIGRMAATEGTTIVLTTHYMEEAEEMCDRIAIIDRGRIILEGTPEALRRQAGGDRVLVEGGPFDEAAIRTLPFVLRFQAGERTAVVTVDRAARDLPALLAALGPLTSLEVRAPSLNDVFLEHTGRGIRDEVASSSWMEDAMRHAQGGR